MWGLVISLTMLRNWLGLSFNTFKSMEEKKKMKPRVFILKKWAINEEVKEKKKDFLFKTGRRLFTTVDEGKTRFIFVVS